MSDATEASSQFKPDKESAWTDPPEQDRWVLDPSALDREINNIRADYREKEQTTNQVETWQISTPKRTSLHFALVYKHCIKDEFEKNSVDSNSLFSYDHHANFTDTSHDNTSKDTNRYTSIIEATDSTAFKLAMGASGIYVSYVYYGHIQEDLFLYQSTSPLMSGEKFHYVWMLQAMESLIIVLFGGIMMFWCDTNMSSLPRRPFFFSPAPRK
jgi:hypothetical protein